MTHAIFFITTARSGTQWVHNALAHLYPHHIVAAHEPIHYAYEPRRCLRNTTELRALPNSAAVDHHFQNIHRILESKSYVEVGFPSYAAAPLLVQEFGRRLKFVQFIRHPTRVAASVVTHNWFDSTTRRDIEKSIAPQPFDPGVRWPQFQNRWKRMSRFERALYYWSEVHLYGREVEATFPETPFCRVRFEDLLQSNGEQMRLHDFLLGGPSPDWGSMVTKHIDRYRRIASVSIDPSTALRHPEIVALAREFGYSFDEVPKSLIRDRYVAPAPARVRYFVKQRLKRLKRAVMRRARRSISVS